VTEAFIFEELHPKKPEEKKGGQFDFVQQTSRATQSHKLLLLFVSLLGSLQEAPAPWKAWCCQEGWSLERRRGITVFASFFALKQNKFFVWNTSQREPFCLFTLSCLPSGHRRDLRAPRTQDNLVLRGQRVGRFLPLHAGFDEGG